MKILLIAYSIQAHVLNVHAWGIVFASHSSGSIKVSLCSVSYLFCTYIIHVSTHVKSVNDHLQSGMMDQGTRWHFCTQNNNFSSLSNINKLLLAISEISCFVPFYTIDFQSLISLCFRDTPHQLQTVNRVSKILRSFIEYIIQKHQLGKIIEIVDSFPALRVAANMLD